VQIEIKNDGRETSTIVCRPRNTHCVHLINDRVADNVVRAAYGDYRETGVSVSTG